jgi:Putative transposase
VTPLMRPTAATSIRTDQRVPSPPPDQPCEWTPSFVVPAGQRERLERVCRYALRPPVTPERLVVVRSEEHAVRKWLESKNAPVERVVIRAPSGHHFA